MFLVIWIKKIVGKILASISVVSNLTNLKYGMDENRIILEMVHKVMH